MMAEYVALSMCLREVIPLKLIVNEIATHLGYKRKIEYRTRSTIFEDNQGALLLANAPFDTPQSKFYACKLHWFREHVRSGTVGIKRVDTHKQIGRHLHEV